MKLGVTPWDFGRRTAQALTEQAQAAEALGYDSFWLPETHFNPGALPDPLMLLAGVAAGTRRLKLATTSYLLPLRHPLQAAEQVAVLDQLSDGRVILGIGRGYAPSMLQAFNVVPSEKRRVFEASLETMRRAWRGDPVVLEDGVTSVVLDPLPLQQPHPPLWVAAFGPKALAQAGRLGLPYLASPMETLEKLQLNYQHHHAAASDSGIEPARTRPIMRTVFVSDNRREVRELQERMVLQAAKLGRLAADTPAEQWAIMGDAVQVRDQIAEYRERLEIDYLVVTRLRVDGVPKAAVHASMAAVAEIAG